MSTFKYRIVSKNPAQTKALGREIACFLKKGDVVGLFGELGSGKTTMAQSIIKALGVSEPYILSPTFVLIREYKGKFRIFHLDLYRLNYLQELLDLGYENYVYNRQAVTIIEWAQKIENLLPKNYLKIELFNKTKLSRLINIEGVGSCSKRALFLLKKKLSI